MPVAHRFHIHSFDQFYYVIDGNMSVDIGLNKYQADASPWWFFRPASFTKITTMEPVLKDTSRFSRHIRAKASGSILRSRFSEQKRSGSFRGESL